MKDFLSKYGVLPRHPMRTRWTGEREQLAAVPSRRILPARSRAPTRDRDGHADLSFVHAAAEEVAAAMDGYTVIVDLRNIYRPEEMAKEKFTYVSVDRAPVRCD